MKRCPIKYVVGDATDPQGKGDRIICHICNNFGGWGSGFVVSLSTKWKQPEKWYREAFRLGRDTYSCGGKFNLGMVQFVCVEKDIWVANMVAQRDPKEHSPAVDYRRLATCLHSVKKEFEEGGYKSIHMPRIGCGIGGGKWEEIEPIIQRCLCKFGIPVYVYDLETPVNIYDLEGK